MALPLVSIIIPLYNVTDYILQCLQSVSNQTYSGLLECIIVDDCGTDNSLAKAEHFVASYIGPIKFQILHHDYNKGLSAARNTGLAAAKGEYVFFLDSDDYISDDCIEILAKPLKEKEYDIVLGDLEMFGEPRNIIFLPEKEGELLGNSIIFHRFYVDRMIYIMAWNKLIKTDLLRKNDISFLEGQLHEDELWSYKVITHIESLYVIKNITYYYRIRGNSITADYRNNIKKRLDSCYQTIHYVLEHPANVSTDDYNHCCIYYFAIYIRNTMVKKLHFRNNYIELRKMFDYHPFKLYKSHKIGFSEFKHQLHFSLPPSIGYIYLELRRIKHVLTSC